MNRAPAVLGSLTQIVFTAMLLTSRPAAALQPLDDFLVGARTANFDNREQRATIEQRSWERSSALGRLIPSASAKGVYQYNQYEQTIALPAKTVIMTPQYQRDAYFQLDIPLVDVAAYERYAQSRHLESAAEAQLAYTDSQQQSSVARTYFSLIGTSALARAAHENLTIAMDNEKYVTTRAEFGAATDLDVERAKANVEKARQDVADSQLARDLAAQNLETLTGITPTEVVDFPTTTLEPEAPISYWLSNTQTPADRVQEELNLASTAGRRAATAALLPTLSANAQERLTNATGLSGHQSVYQIQAVATFKLDWSTYATSRTQGAADSVQQIRAARTRRMTRDAIFEAFRRIETGIAKCKSTRAQSESARKASVLATERYRAGTATQLDVTQAQRDAFVAEAGRIQADADLAFARIQLRTLTGKLIAKSR